MRFCLILFLFSIVYAVEITVNSTDWECTGGSGSIQMDSQTGETCLVLHGNADQPETFHWRLNYPFQPNEIYQLSVNIKLQQGSPDGVVLFGTDFCNKDVRPQNQWQQYDLVFQTPASGRHYIRMGKWNNNAEIRFSNIRLIRLKSSFTALGKSESIRNSQYSANFSYRHLAGNYQRCLYDFNAYFNTKRWDFRGTQFLIYKHDIAVQQKNARLKLKTLYTKLGILQIYASTDARHWQLVAMVCKNGVHEFEIPSELFPAHTIYIKMQNLNPAGRIQIDEYQFTAKLEKTADKSGREQLFSLENSAMLLQSSVLQDDSYGQFLYSKNSINFWWTENAHKIAKTRSVPQQQSRSIQIELAKNEFEAAQLVVSPQVDVGISINPGAFKKRNGSALPQDAVQVYRVGYVFIDSPTDRLGEVGDWPDPLLPLEGQIQLKGGENHPFWIDVHISSDQQAGEYKGDITIRSVDHVYSVPLSITVWDFAVPAEQHVDAVMSFDFWSARRYHHIKESDTQMLKLCDAYFHNFAEHRISPYDPFVLYPIDIHFNAQTLQAEFDFTKFDQGVQKYIHQFGFSRFRLHFPWLGHGVIQCKDEGKTVTFRRGSKEYEKLAADYLQKLEQHLKELNILDKAYVYWKDEPERNEYKFVRNGMQLLKKYAPEMTRMLTEQPEEELFGFVDVWCPLTGKFQPDIVKQRQQAGDQFWWYVCSSPQVPYATLFIDHHALEMRLWLWQTWQYDVKGVLIWQANYWTSPLVFPPPQRQNPYEDAMSYVSGYNKPKGTIEYWGNGDGRLIYPPPQVFQSDQPNVHGPINSIRWEMLRDGLEDYEYLWLLQSLVVEAKEKNIRQSVIRDAEQLLIIPSEISKNLTSFTTNPDVLLQHRRKVAEMIEKLQNLL